MPRLVILNPDFDNQTCELTDGTFLVGRGPDARILIEDGSVSWEHCDLLVWGDELIVRVRDPGGGVFLDGVPWAEP